ncbi:MAG: ABC transporter substrate-binding protein [Rhodospirillaceae bacterium]|nr:ABC transporter substrate-binding protein [Rhodospirillaceae bacterium]
MVRTITAATVLAASLATAIPDSVAHDMTTLTDTEGRTVEVPHGAERVLLGFYFEDFYAIVGENAFDRVVAISRPIWQDWRPAQYERYVAVAPRIDTLVDVGNDDAGAFSIEVAIAAQPDVAIIAQWQYAGIGEEGVADLEAAGIPVVVVDYNAQTLERHLASTRIIGQVMAAETRADVLAGEYEAAVTDVIDRIARSAEGRPPVYVELGNKGPAEYGNSYGATMWGGVVTMAGGDNIAETQIQNWGPLSPEYVLASRPEAIFLAGSDWLGNDSAVLMGFGVDDATTRARLRAYLDRPGWSGLPAVANGNVHALYHGGTRTLYDYTFLQYMAKVLHPQAFADIDPIANHRRYYETYLPIAPDGTFMLGLD